MASTNPQELTTRGRLSYPTWTYEEALKRNASSKFPKKADDVRPNVQFLLTQSRADALIAHLKDVFIPWCVEQDKLGDKGKSRLTPAQAKKLTKILDEQDWEVDGVLGLIKPVYEKTAELAPEAVLQLAVNGMKGQDLGKKAIVRSESELKNPLDDLVIPARGLIMPIADTTLELYPGANVAATLNFFAFTAAGQPGIQASTGAVIFTSDNERFGGGGGVIDEEAIFLDDGEDDDAI